MARPSSVSGVLCLHRILLSFFSQSLSLTQLVVIEWKIYIPNKQGIFFIFPLHNCGWFRFLVCIFGRFVWWWWRRRRRRSSLSFVVVVALFLSFIHSFSHLISLAHNIGTIILLIYQHVSVYVHSGQFATLPMCSCTNRHRRRRLLHFCPVRQTIAQQL